MRSATQSYWNTYNERGQAVRLNKPAKIYRLPTAYEQEQRTEDYINLCLGAGAGAALSFLLVGIELSAYKYGGWGGVLVAPLLAGFIGVMVCWWREKARRGA